MEIIANHVNILINLINKEKYIFAKIFLLILYFYISYKSFLKKSFKSNKTFKKKIF